MLLDDTHTLKLLEIVEQYHADIGLLLDYFDQKGSVDYNTGLTYVLIIEKSPLKQYYLLAVKPINFT